MQLLPLLILVIITCTNGHEKVQYIYDRQESWLSLSPNCGQAIQSPVDLGESVYATNLLPLRVFSNGTTTLSFQQRADIIRGQFTNTLRSLLFFGNVRYYFSECYLHLHTWPNRPGSEHTLDGQRFDLEIEFELINQPVKGGRQRPGGVVYLSLLFNETKSSDDNDQFLRQFLPLDVDLLAYRIGNGDGDRVGPVMERHLLDVAGLLREYCNLERYFYYLGSRSQPTCEAEHHRIILADVLTISPGLMAELKRLPMSRLGHNYRWTQNLNGRRVKRSFELPTELMKHQFLSTQGTPWNGHGQNGPGLLVTFHVIIGYSVLKIFT